MVDDVREPQEQGQEGRRLRRNWGGKGFTTIGAAIFAGGRAGTGVGDVAYRVAT